MRLAVVGDDEGQELGTRNRGTGKEPLVRSSSFLLFAVAESRFTPYGAP